MTTLTVTASTDYSTSFLFHTDTLVFDAPADAVFSGTQFYGNQLSDTLAVEGSFGMNRIIVESGIRGLDASGWTFTFWGGLDRLVIDGSVWDETLTGSIRNDTIFGNDGNDTIRGGAGRDIIEGGAGADVLRGGLGQDWLSYDGSSAAVTVDLAANAVSGGDARGDSVKGFENALGSDFADRLIGSAVANRLEGGLGADVLTGGAGADRFVYESRYDSPAGPGRDLITDFSQADHDRIDLRTIDAVAYTNEIEHLHFVGTGAFLEPGDLRNLHIGSLTVVEADLTGDGWSDVEIALQGHFTLTRGDFIL